MSADKHEKFEMPEMSTLNCGACATIIEATGRKPISGEQRADEAVASFLIGAAEVIRTGESGFRAGLCKDHREVFSKLEVALKERLGTRR